MLQVRVSSELGVTGGSCWSFPCAGVFQEASGAWTRGGGGVGVMDGGGRVDNEGLRSGRCWWAGA